MSSDEDEIEREVRGATRGMRINRIVEAVGHTVPLTWTPAQGKLVGGMATVFNAEIGILGRTFIPLKYAKKKEIPNVLYISMIERLLNQFDIDISQPHIRKYIIYQIGNRYKDYRARLYRHYKKSGDPSIARERPHKYVTSEDWKLLCDRWESPTWKEKSRKNKESRSKLPFNHRARSKSFLSHLEDKKKEDGTYLSHIEMFYETHKIAAKGWSGKLAEEAYEKMVAIREEQLRTSSSPVDDEEIMSSVLGKRKNYVRGMGYGPKPPRNEGSSSYSQEYVKSLENRLAKAEEILKTQQTHTEEWMQTQLAESEKARE